MTAYDDDAERLSEADDWMYEGDYHNENQGNLKCLH